LLDLLDKEADVLKELLWIDVVDQVDVQLVQSQEPE
jgi:hypothetical protein